MAAIKKTEEAAQMIGCQPSSLKVARSTGRGVLATLPFIKMGRMIRYDEAEINNWLSARRVAPDTTK